MLGSQAIASKRVSSRVVISWPSTTGLTHSILSGMGVGVGVTVKVGVTVLLGVGVRLGVSVFDGVNVGVGVFVAVFVSVLPGLTSSLIRITRKASTRPVR